jgi:hypothetical protein
MRRIREILLTDYIGAIAIGFISAQAILAFVGAFTTTAAFYVQERSHPGVLNRSAVFPWDNLIISFVSVGLYLAAAFLLARWLYPSMLVAVTKDASLTDPQ